MTDKIFEIYPHNFNKDKLKIEFQDSDPQEFSNRSPRWRRSYKVGEYGNYLKDLYINNQKYNFSEPFSLSASDTTIASNKGRYLEVADFDLGALGRASLRVQGNINLSGKLVNQDQELVRSSYKEQEKTNFLAF